jgi:cytidyltransferase-like protein
MAFNPKVRIMVFGTFDVLHKGHLNFFKQARQLANNPYLIVSVARDANVKKIKGHKTRYNEKQRLKAVKKNRLVNKALLGSLKNYLGHIISQKPQVIALGYDQKAYTQGLKTLLAGKGLKVRIRRLKPFFPSLYKSSIVKREKG